MKRLALPLLVLTLFCTRSEAQNIGINVNGAAPNVSALLDIDVSAIVGTKRGLLIPRMTTAERNAIPTPATSLLIFNTTTVQFEYFDGTLWRGLLSTATAGWGLTGNAGTNPATNFIGTTDAQVLRFRVNNLFAGNLSTTANGLVSLGLNAGSANTALSNTFIGGNAGALNTTGTSNTFIGQGAGAANTTTANNTYIGTGAGQANTTGQQNVYVGRLAGGNGTTGSDNILIGNGAGIGNTSNNNVMIGSFSGNGNTTGGGNTFLGVQSGAANSTGGQNTFIGTGAGSTNTNGTQNTLVGNGAALNAGNLTNATAIGRGSRVDVSDGLILGSVMGINGATSTSLIGIGTTAPLDRLHVVGNIRMVDGNQALGRIPVSNANGTMTWTDPLTVATGLAWTLTGNGGTNPATNFIGTTDNQPLRFRVNNTLAGNLPTIATGTLALGLLVGVATTGQRNTFLGNEAGAATTTGQSNTFVGYRSGNTNTTGGLNTFVGDGAGSSNTTGASNTCLGSLAGRNLTTGQGNVLIGTLAGLQMTASNSNVLIGNDAGNSCISDDNTMVGSFAGHVVSTGAENAFFGRSAGENTDTGTGNTFIGSNSANLNQSGSEITCLGHLSDVLNNIPLTNATAIGSMAVVGASNCMVLGSVAGMNGATNSVNVGIGVTAPVAKLQAYTAPNATKTQLTQGLLSSGLLVTTDFTAGSYTPGLFWNTTNNNVTKPKAGIYLQETAAGTSMYLATSNNYANGITNDGIVIDPAGNVGIGTSAPLTAADVLGGLALRDDGSVASITADNQLVTVGNRGYIRLGSNSATATTRTITLSNGLVRGQLLMIQASPISNSFEVADNTAANNTDVPIARVLDFNDTIMLLWNGSEWIELSYANN
jgi:hypothetical protein